MRAERLRGTAILFGVCIVGLAASAAFPLGEPVTVSGKISMAGKTKGSVDSGNAAVWLTPVVRAAQAAGERSSSREHAKIVQKNKQFDPPLLIVRVGTVVDFPNLDPFFHNVFSLFEGKRFDLGLYEAGAGRSVSFNKAGVCYVFCNIHPAMSAVVVAVDTPYYAVSRRTGEFTLPEVPPGRYLLSVWHERAKPERPNDYPRELTISQANRSLGEVRLVESDEVIPHKNKYGRDYLPAPPVSPIYK